jgi:hypothetical protein
MIDKIGINFRVELSHIERLKKIAREKSYRENRDITYTDLIKEAYEEKYKLRSEDVSKTKFKRSKKKI